MKRNALILVSVLLVVLLMIAFAWGMKAPSRPGSRTQFGPGIRSGQTTYEYDSLNRLTKVTYADGAQILYYYDANGNRTSKLVSPAY